MGSGPVPLRPFATGEVWALTASEAADFDAWSIDEVGVPQPVLMENAGRAVASVLQRLAPEGPVLALVGSGNNGGDALVAGRTLAAWGREVRVVLVADRAPDDPLLHGWPVPVSSDAALDSSAWKEVLAAAAVVVDGILGTGVRGAARPRQAVVIDRLNEGGRWVLAIDVPSGIDATTGAVAGSAVRADVTVSFGMPKLGALLHPARARVGRHVVAEIGFPPLRAAAAGARVITPAWARRRLPRRATDTHKNAVGRVLVVGGSLGMAGAPILTARGALRAGAGLVRVCSVAANREPIQASLPEALFVDGDRADEVAEAVSSSDGIVAGPGLGSGADAAGLLGRVLDAGGVPTVLDADALNLAAAGRVDLAAVAGRRPTLITPHPGEMARLLPDGPSATEERIACLRAAVERFGCAVLLKGAPSLVGAPGGRVSVDTQSSSDLAVAGLGDVLAGVCAALLARGTDTETAATVGLYLSGRAARLAGRGAGLLPTDVIRWLPDALGEGVAPVTDLGLPFVTFDADAAR